MSLYNKSLFLVILTISFFSCSNDDDTPASIPFEEKILGTWQLIDREPNGIEFCELSTTIQFSEGNELFVEIFIGDAPENCQSASRSGTWNYLGNNQLEVDLNGVEENTTLEVVFSDSNTQLELTNTSEQVTQIYAKQ